MIPLRPTGPRCGLVSRDLDRRPTRPWVSSGRRSGRSAATSSAPPAPPKRDMGSRSEKVLLWLSMLAFARPAAVSGSGVGRMRECGGARLARDGHLVVSCGHARDDPSGGVLAPLRSLFGARARRSTCAARARARGRRRGEPAGVSAGPAAGHRPTARRVVRVVLDRRVQRIDGLGVARLARVRRLGDARARSPRTRCRG